MYILIQRISLKNKIVSKHLVFYLKKIVSDRVDMLLHLGYIMTDTESVR